MTYWDQMPIPTRDRVLSDDSSWDTYSSYSKRLPSGPYAYNDTPSYRQHRVYKRVWDTVVPNWKQRMNDGEIITNDLLEYVLEGTHNYFTYLCVVRNATETREVAGAVGCGSNLDTFYSENSVDEFADALEKVVPDAGSLRAEAVTAAYARVDVSELEILASLGEMPETVNWFRDVLKRLIAAMASLKKRQYLETLNQLKRALRTGKGRKRTALAVSDGTQDYWMEWRYAIRPLIFEVQSYLAALDTKVESAVRKTARKSTFDYSTSTSNFTRPQDWIHQAYVSQTVTESRAIRSGVMYSLNPENMGWWTHLGLDAPVSAAWAITRLSFVLDWFFNIGQWIASWEPRLGLTPLTSWVVETRQIDTHTEWTARYIPVAEWPTLVSYDVKSLGEQTRMVRTKARWANPDRQVLPSYRYTGLNTAKVADLVVIGQKLARQLLS